ncbi:DsbA family protein [Ahrensia marina]|uniref:DsbA family protein n=1 Tax=Ahrensia marina TaxID=1514904 RepID=UPI0009ECB59B|nr:DsbA family protein [Ahrensia marina]
MRVNTKAITRSNIIIHLLRGSLIILALAWMSVPATADDQMSEDQIKQLALEAIMENPEIIQQAFERLEQIAKERQDAQLASILSDRRDELERDPNAPILGNPDGDVTIVEFFDYNCPYCRRVKPEIAALLERDDNVRLVYREWPILGPGSVYAARAALASQSQGKYEEFHWALMSLEGRAEEQAILETAASIGLDIEQLQADMNAPEIDSHIAVSMELAEGLNITGTPTFIIGKSIAPGLVETDRLVQMVDEARLESQ